MTDLRVLLPPGYFLGTPRARVTGGQSPTGTRPHPLLWGVGWDRTTADARKLSSTTVCSRHGCLSWRLLEGSHSQIAAQRSHGDAAAVSQATLSQGAVAMTLRGP